MEDKINRIWYQMNMKEITSEQARQQVLDLFAVSGSVCNKHSFKFKRLGTIGRKVMKCKNCGFIAN